MEKVLPLPILRRLPASSGSGVLRGTWTFDFDAGIETSNSQLADVWWDQITATERQLVPMNGARLCGMGQVAYDALGLSDLANLPFSTTPIPGNVSGSNALVDGSVFAVHTKLGNFVKVQVIHYGYNLEIRWQRCERPLSYLNVNVTLGDTPTWLVARYAAECTYNTPNGIRNCGRGVFGAEGGIVNGQVSDEGGAFPSTINVTITIDFQPDTTLAGLVKTFTPPVTNTGVNFLFEPFHVIQKTDLFFDFQPLPIATDYLLLRWKHVAGGVVVASGQKYLAGDDLRKQPITQYEIVFVPDPILAKDFSIEFEGRYQHVTLPLFAQTYDLSEKAVIIRARKAPSGQGYILVSV
jgi:hypothetical protein